MFIDEHRAAYGVEPICRALAVASSTHRARKAREREPSARAISDKKLLMEIRRVYVKNHRLYGARKVWCTPLPQSAPLHVLDRLIELDWQIEF